MFKILGTDDAVNTCDCCGKTNLKATVIVEVNGEILHYGSVCATRHTGKNKSQIAHEIEVARVNKQAAALAEFRATPEAIAEQAKIAEAHRLGIRPGKEFRAFTLEATNAAFDRKHKIAFAHGLKAYQF